MYWANATVDGVRRLQSWDLAKDNNWFENVEDVDKLDLLVVIAAHSESQFCLDYRESGKKGMPGIVYIDVSRDPTEVKAITSTVDEFIDAIVALQPQGKAATRTKKTTKAAIRSPKKKATKAKKKTARKKK